MASGGILLAFSGYFDATFFASLSTYSYGDVHPVIFDRVMINPGNHYNNNTGIYTVPYDGVYQFSFHAQYYGYLAVQMYVDDSQNDSHVDAIFGNQNTYFRTSSTILSLTSGQTVHLGQSRNDSGVYGDPTSLFSYFSGHLIQAN